MLPCVEGFLAQKYPRDHFDFEDGRHHNLRMKACDVTRFGTGQTLWLQRSAAFSDTSGIAVKLIQISPAVSLVSRIIRCPQFRNFCPLVPLRKSFGGPFEALPTRRGYAVLMLLARLGLRTCEIVRLELEDIDWELGQITIRGKFGRWSKLPLPPDVGQALSAYLQHDRSRCAGRQIGDDMKVVRHSSRRCRDRVSPVRTDRDIAGKRYRRSRSRNYTLIGFTRRAVRAVRRWSGGSVREHGTIQTDLRSPKLIEVRRRAAVELSSIPHLGNDPNPAGGIPWKNLGVKTPIRFLLSNRRREVQSRAILCCR